MNDNKPQTTKLWDVITDPYHNHIIPNFASKWALGGSTSIICVTRESKREMLKIAIIKTCCKIYPLHYRNIFQGQRVTCTIQHLFSTKVLQQSKKKISNDINCPDNITSLIYGRTDGRNSSVSETERNWQNYHVCMTCIFYNATLSRYTTRIDHGSIPLITIPFMSLINWLNNPKHWFKNR